MQVTREQLQAATRAAANEYAAKWRNANREHIRDYQRKWHAEHPNAQAEYNRRFRERKALEKLAADNGCSVDEIEVI